MGNDSTTRRFIRISNDSGCFLANYSSTSKDDESIIVRFEENNEMSGRFKLPATREKN